MENKKLREQLFNLKISNRMMGVSAEYKENMSIDKFIDSVANALSKGAEIVQLRGDGLTDKDFLESAIKIKQLCELFEATFIIDSRVDIAYLSKADCLNLNRNDIDIRSAKEIIGEDIFIGMSIYENFDFNISVKGGVDYISVYPIFPTPTEPVMSTGLEYAKWVSENTPFSVLVGGNINKTNYHTLSDIKRTKYLVDIDFFN